MRTSKGIGTKFYLSINWSWQAFQKTIFVVTEKNWKAMDEKHATIAKSAFWDANNGHFPAKKTHRGGASLRNTFANGIQVKKSKKFTWIFKGHGTLRQRNTSEQIEQVYLIAQGATVLSNLLIEQLNIDLTTQSILINRYTSTKRKNRFGNYCASFSKQAWKKGKWAKQTKICNCIIAYEQVFARQHERNLGISECSNKWELWTHRRRNRKLWYNICLR